jgi:hypothetical protein
MRMYSKQEARIQGTILDARGRTLEQILYARDWNLGILLCQRL